MQIGQAKSSRLASSVSGAFVGGAIRFAIAPYALVQRFKIRIIKAVIPGRGPKGREPGIQ